MEIIFNSNANSFLDLYESEIIFLNQVKLCETQEDVLYFLDEYGLTKEDVANAGINISKNVITIPTGTKATVLFSGQGWTTLSIKDITFDYNFSYDADQCTIEATCKDGAREAAFAPFNRRLPASDDTTILGKYYISDILEAVAELNYEGRRLPAFEEMKLMTYDEMQTKLRRYAQRLASKLDFDVQLDIQEVELETLNVIKELMKG